MTINKLLTGAAVAALLAGAAQAQTVVNPAGGAGEFDGQTIASEVGGTLDGNVRLNFGLDGVFAAMGAGGVVQVDFTLTNATFDGIVPAGAWTAAADADCNFGAPILGGGAGSTTVRFENTAQINECDTALGAAGDPDTGFVNLPIVVTNNGDPVSINVSFTPTADAGVYAGTDVDIDLADFAQAFTYTIAAGAASSGLFNATGEALTGSGDIGTFSQAAWPAGIESDVGVALVNATDIATSGSLVVTFPSGADGLDPLQVDLAAVACTQGAAPADNEFTCAVAVNDYDNGAPAGTIDIIHDAGAGSVVAQTPTAAFTVTANAGNTVSGATGDLAEIELDNGLDTTTLGTFEWVKFGDGGTESNFRIQFADEDEANAVQQIIVTVALDGNGVLAGTYNVPMGTDASTEGRAQGSTVTFNSRALGATGASGNADISVAVEYTDTEVGIPGSTIQRQLVNRTPASFVATPGLESDAP